MECVDYATNKEKCLAAKVDCSHFQKLLVLTDQRGRMKMWGGWRDSDGNVKHRGTEPFLFEPI